MKYLVLFVVCCLQLFAKDYHGMTKHTNTNIQKEVLLKILFKNKTNSENISIMPNDLVIKSIKKDDNVLHLKSILESDIVYCAKKLRGLGFFSGSAKYTCREDKKQFHVIFIIDYGKKYRIKNIKINCKKLPLSVDVSDLINKRVDFEKILALEKKIVETYCNLGYPFVEVTKKKMKVFHDSDSVDVYFDVALGDKCSFGDTVIVGNNDVKEQYILKQITWSRDDEFSLQKVEQLKKNLLKLNLFQKITIKHEKMPEKKVLTIIDVKEDKKHLFEFGAKYSTSNNVFYSKKLMKKMTGILATCSFSNFNIFGNGEILNLYLEGMPFYTKNAFSNKVALNEVSPDFKLKTTLKRQKYDGAKDIFYTATYYNTWNIKYVKRSKELEFIISRFNEVFSYSFGLNVEFYKLMDFSTTKSGHLLKKRQCTFIGGFCKLINKLKLVNENVVLYEAYFAPKIAKNSVFELNLKVTGLLNFKLFSVILWGSYDCIFTRNINELPADKLLYSGGTNSVRAYAKNYASKFDGDYPNGGRACIEAGVELIKKITKKWDAAVFMDCSKLGREMMPMHAELFYGIGVGARYHMDVGTIKIDIATPLRKRNFDSRIQILISVGSQF